MYRFSGCSDIIATSGWRPVSGQSLLKNHTRRSSLFLLIALAACSSGDESSRLPTVTPHDQVKRRAVPSTVDVTAAALLWRLPTKPSTADAWTLPLLPPSIDSFVGVSSTTLDFLNRPNLKPAVQFSCAAWPTPYEDALEEALLSASDSVRLQALVVLLKVRAPSSTLDQWEALNSLSRAIEARGATRELFDELQSLFRPADLLREIERILPEDRYDGLDTRFAWSILACGAIQLRESLPRLVELSRSSHLDGSLAAERAIEEFAGAEGDEALLQCVLGWQYDAFERAGDALVSRNPKLLRAALETAESPAGSRYAHGLLLARCGSPASVPLLCRTVHEIAIVDGEMLDYIKELGTAGNLDEIRAMVRRARPEQRARAQDVLAAVLARSDKQKH